MAHFKLLGKNWMEMVVRKKLDGDGGGDEARYKLCHNRSHNSAMIREEDNTINISRSSKTRRYCVCNESNPQKHDLNIVS